MELTGSLAGFATSVLNLETEKNELTKELEKAKVALAVADSRIQALERDKVTLTSKLEYYQRRCTEFVTRLNTIGSMVLESLREEQIGEYRPNGAAKIEQPKIDMPALVAKLPQDATELPARKTWLK